MPGPCLCGDPYCPSCGPAQGNMRCDICGRWSSDVGEGLPCDCTPEEIAAFNEEMESIYKDDDPL